MRAALRDGTVAEIEKYKVKPNEAFSKLLTVDSTTGHQFDLQAFLQKMPVYKGIQQFYFDDIRGEIDESNFNGSLSKDAKLIMKIRCDKSWTHCIFDFTAMATVNDYFAFVAKPKSLAASLDIDDVSHDFGESAEHTQIEFDLTQFIVPGDYVT